MCYFIHATLFIFQHLVWSFTFPGRRTKKPRPGQLDKWNVNPTIMFGDEPSCKAMHESKRAIYSTSPVFFCTAHCCNYMLLLSSCSKMQCLPHLCVYIYICIYIFYNALHVHCKDKCAETKNNWCILVTLYCGFETWIWRHHIQLDLLDTFRGCTAGDLDCQENHFTGWQRLAWAVFAQFERCRVCIYLSCARLCRRRVPAWRGSPVQKGLQRVPGFVNCDWNDLCQLIRF